MGFLKINTLCFFDWVTNLNNNHKPLSFLTAFKKLSMSFFILINPSPRELHTMQDNNHALFLF